jgi:hypothetical protein
VSEQEAEQIRRTPTKLCRLTWTDDSDSWGFAFYKYSAESETFLMHTRPCLGGVP